MLRFVLVFIFLFNLNFSFSQSDILGEWVGFLIKGKDQFHFELDIAHGKKEDPVILNGFSCKKIKGSIVDFRDSTKIIDFYGIINADRSINMIDSKLVDKKEFEGEFRAHYQFHVEIRNGEPWMIGYWQEYDNKGWKQAQGRIFLKRKPPPSQKA
jgi:hypothetical protein